MPVILIWFLASAALARPRLKGALLATARTVLRVMLFFSGRMQCGHFIIYDLRNHKFDPP